MVVSDKPAGRRIHLAYRPTRSEIKVGIRFVIRHQSKFGWCIGVGVVLMILGIILSWFNGFRDSYILIVLGLVDVIIAYSGFEAGVNRQVRKLKNSPRVLNINRTVEYELATSTFSIIRPIRRRISGYQYIVKRRNCLIISDRNFTRFTVIPKRAFDSSSDEMAFTTELRSHVPSQGPWWWTRLKGL